MEKFFHIFLSHDVIISLLHPSICSWLFRKTNNELLRAFVPCDILNFLRWLFLSAHLIVRNVVLFQLNCNFVLCSFVQQLVNDALFAARSNEPGSKKKRSREINLMLVRMIKEINSLCRNVPQCASRWFREINCSCKCGNQKAFIALVFIWVQLKICFSLYKKM